MRTALCVYEQNIRQRQELASRDQKLRRFIQEHLKVSPAEISSSRLHDLFPFTKLQFWEVAN